MAISARLDLNTKQRVAKRVLTGNHTARVPKANLMSLLFKWNPDQNLFNRANLFGFPIITPSSGTFFWEVASWLAHDCSQQRGHEETRSCVQSPRTNNDEGGARGWT